MSSKGISIAVSYAVGLVLMTGGCGSPPPKAPTDLATSTAQIQVVADRPVRAVQLRTVIVGIDDGQKIGRIASGLTCLSSEPLIQQGTRSFLSPRDSRAVFRDVLRSAGYRVVGDPDQLFENADAPDAELLVGGIVTAVDADICFPRAYFGSRDATGQVSVAISWEIFDRLDRRTVHKTASRGVAHLDQSQAGGDVLLFRHAFASAVRQLAGDKGFLEAVATRRATEHRIAQRRTLAGEKPSAEPITGMMPDVQRAVLTVFAGDGHGSGFFVSRDGHVLTNQHVVGGANYVKLRDVTGREEIGEVVATDPRRDVALIKAAGTAPRPLPISRSQTSTGAGVYTVGTPMLPELQSTVTRGIVSGIRELEGLSFIQSDAAILPGNSGGPLLDESGNVIGIAVMRHRDTSSLNFFIPIGDALDRLGVVME